MYFETEDVTVKIRQGLNFVHLWGYVFRNWKCNS